MFKEFIQKLTKNKYYLIGAISILLLLVITLGSAALRSTLSLIGTTHLNENSWIIYFDHVHDEQFQDNVTPEKRAVIVDRAKTRIEFTVDLQPGELYEYTVDVINDGTIDAMIDHIEKYELSNDQKKYLEFDVKYTENDKTPDRCDKLNAQTSREVKVTVRYKPVDDYHNFPTEDLHLDLFFDIYYVQKFDCNKEEGPSPYKLLIDPNGGIYTEGDNKRTDVITKYLLQDSEDYSSTYTVREPARLYYNFTGWEVVYPEHDGTYTFNESTGLFSVGTEDVYLRATWEEGNFVARIENKYYPTIQEAFNEAGLAKWSDNTVHLLKDTTEYPTNNTSKPFKFDLESHTVTGTITNSSIGNITLVNGRVKAGENDEEAFINNGVLNLGQDDGVVQVENSVSLVGNEIGLLNNSNNGAVFNFYDGYIEGDKAIIRGYDGHPDHYVVFVNHITETNKQRAYLVNDATRAVAKTTTDGEIYYYVLQDAIDAVVENKATFDDITDDEYVIYAIRDFEASYPLSVPADSRIFIDTVNFRIWTGETITNAGYLEIYSNNNTRSTIQTSKTISNSGELKINNIKLNAETETTIISNTGKLDLSNTEVHGKRSYAVSNTEQGTITFDEDTFIDSAESYGIYNSSSKLKVDDGTIYGIYNTSNGATISDDADIEVYHWTTPRYDGVDHHYIPAVLNEGTLNITGGTITTDYNVCMIDNRTTLNISGGTIESPNKTICNNQEYSSGTLNVTGGNINSTNNTVIGGTTNVSNNAIITSDNGSVISDGAAVITNGTIKSQTGTAVYNTNITVNAGEVYSESGVAVSNPNYDRTLTMNGGRVYSLDGAAVTSSNVTMTAGSIEGTTYGINQGGTLTMSGGTITSTDKGVVISNANITGGTITSPNDALTTTNLTMNGGSVISTEATAITVNGNGTVLDGTITGDMYGILNNGNLTIGEDDGTISPTVPTIIGGSVGVEIQGESTAFFDGILKGQIDGYRGEVTRTPLGGTTASGTDTIDEVVYQTDYIIQFQPWLEIEGVGQFNTIDAASEAIPDGGTATIKVIADVTPSFVQHFKDENHNKTITFDLNGHTLRSTQVAYNEESNVTVIDSVGTGKITNDISYYFENNRNMTVNGVKIVSTGNKAAIRNYRYGTLTIESANIRCVTNCISSMGDAIINDVDLVAEQDALYIESFDELYDRAFGSIVVNGGTIVAGNRGVYGRSYFEMNGGSITSTNDGVTGPEVLINDGSIHSTNGKAINVDSTVEMNGGSVIADNDIGIHAQYEIHVNGGYVSGTTGIQHYPWHDFYGHAHYEDIYVTDGTIVGTQNYGVYQIGNDSFITGGEIYGEVDGLYAESHAVVGTNEGSISKTSPLIQGKRYGVRVTSTFDFFDGILKGANAARNGQVSLIPDGALVIDDYEFINRVEYKTEYLEGYGNWLRVGETEYNSLYAAQEAIADYGTVYVIRDANINFEQSLVAGKHVTLDLNGHQVMMTKTLTTNGTNTVTDSSSGHTGSLTNISAVEDLAAITNEGTLTIGGGTYSSNRYYAISNPGTMVINDINLVTDGAIITSGNMTINGGHIESNGSLASLYVNGTTTINDGTIVSNTTRPVYVDRGSLYMTGGTVTASANSAIYVNSYNNYSEISGGTVTGYINGIQVEGNNHDFVISGGHIIGETECAVTSSNNRTKVTGGILEGETYGLDVRYGGTIGIDDRDVKIDAPVIKGNLYGLNIPEGTLNFNDGILKGISGSEQGIITNIPAGTQIYTDTEIIDGFTYNTKYLIQEKDLAYNVNLDKYYNNLQVAVDEAQDNNTIELLTNIPIYYPVTNNNTHAFTLDLKGYSISTNKPIVNNGNLTITDSASTHGTIKTSSAIQLISNTGTLLISNIELMNTSSSNYILSSNNTLTINNATITGINGVNASNTLSINGATVNTSENAVVSSGDLTILGGTYTGNNYAIYSSGYNNSRIENATVNGRVYNTRGTLTARESTINLRSGETVDNNGVFNILSNTQILGHGYVYNGGTMTMSHMTMNVDGYRSYSYPYNGISNSGTLTIDNSTITVEETRYQSATRGIYNSGTLYLNEASILNVGDNLADGYDYSIGLNLVGSGQATIDGGTINVKGKNNAYGLYIDSSNAKATILSGNVNVSNTKYGTGALVNTGTLELGFKDNVQDESDLVSQTDPRFYISGNIKGIGVKKVNGNFNFYDGVIWASSYARQGTTTNVENYYEVTTYIDEPTSYEVALLEYMGADYDETVVAMIGLHSYHTLQSAINAYDKNDGEDIILVRSVDEDITIGPDQDVVIDLHGMSLTTSLTNNGKLQLFNGTVIELSYPENPELNDYINNYGTLILGKDDGVVSSSSVRVIAENTAINNIYDSELVHNEGRLEMYDGYIEGNPAVNGKIDKIADFSRLYTKKDTLYERVYLQSLSEDAIRDRETALILNIDPNGGEYQNSTDVTTEFLYYTDEYELVPNPTKNACVFVGWEANDSSVLSQVDDHYKVTVGLKDIELTAIWEIDPSAVAKIGNNYYMSIEEAHAAAKAGDVIELIKDITLDDEITITITKNVTLDLGGHVISGNVTDNAVLINNGELTIKNGTITNAVNNETGIGVINNKTIILGTLDETVDVNNVKIFGKAVGMQQDGRLDFYDGTIEGLVSMNGGVSAAPKGYFLYTEPNESFNPPTQKLFLSGNPENAVAIIEDGANTQYFFKLTSAIASAAVNNKEIKIIKDFEATYPVTVSEGMDIVINMFGYNITTGQPFTNNGTLKIYDSNIDNPGSITSAKTFGNTGTLTIEDITINQNYGVNTIDSSGTLTIKDATINNSSTSYAVNNTGHLVLQGDVTLTSTKRAIYTNGTMAPVTGGLIKGIETYNDITINEGTTISGNNTYTALYIRDSLTATINGGSIISPDNEAIYFDSSNANLYINGGYLEGNYAIRINSGENNKIIIDDKNYDENDSTYRTVYGKNRAIHVSPWTNNDVTLEQGVLYGDQYGVVFDGKDDHFTMNGGKIYAATYDGLHSNNGNSTNVYFDINGGFIQGNRYGIYEYIGVLTVANAEIKTISNSQNDYAIYTRWGGTTLEEGAFINAPNASGIYAEDEINLEEGSKIYAGHAKAYGIYGYWLQGTCSGEIETPGMYSYGIYIFPHHHDNLFYTIDGGEITSANIGIGLSQSDRAGYVLNINSGNIIGENYGVYVINNNFTVNIGDVEDPLSTRIPFIQGNVYGVYNDAGYVNFYNGRLRGSIYGYYDEMSRVRPGKDITYEYTELDTSENRDILTLAASSASSTPLADTAKKNNGYAKITYLGETVEGVCEQNQVYPFDYTGTIVTWNAPCSGSYKFEVWGAAGSYYHERYESGFGGYSVGQIDLALNEQLFIVVGGEGPFYGSNNYGPGGYNGGGGVLAWWNDGNERRGSGGGATHIATRTGLLKELENNKSDVLIVAGGGGGAATNAVLMDSGRGIAGNGGGYIGGTGYGNNYYDDDRFGAGGTQTTGYAFGQGEESTQGNLSGAGGGWYGGYQTNRGSGGGSGYIGNTRLTNKHMAGYNVPYMLTSWIDNYLVDKEAFLQVGNETFNNIDDASAAIAKNGTGTIRLIKDATIQEDSKFLADRNITFDLEGHVLNTTVSIDNYANLTIVDSSNNKTGNIIGIYNNTINNHSSITLDAVKVSNTSGDKVVLYSDTANSVFTLTDANITGYIGIKTEKNSTITMDDTEIHSVKYGIITTDSNTNTHIISGSIDISGTSDSYGIYSSGHNNVLTIDDIDLTSDSIGLYIYGNSSVTTINSGHIYGKTYAIYAPNSHNTSQLPKLYIKGGLIEALESHTIDQTYMDVYISGGEVKSLANNIDVYALVNRSYSTVYISGTAFINAPNASAAYSHSGYQISGGKLFSGATNGRGIYSDWLYLEMTGGEIETTGNNSTGIYTVNSRCEIHMSDGTIKSNYDGLRLDSYYDTRSVNISGGTIDAKNYGIYVLNDIAINVGNTDDVLSQTNPHITGGKMALFNQAGTANFYNGRLTSNVDINYREFNNIRTGKEIIYDYDMDEDEVTTVSVGNYSATPKAAIPKEGNGYARITYLDGGDIFSQKFPGYTMVDYIESTGTQYINTNYIPKTNTKVEMDISFNGTFRPYATYGGSPNFFGTSEADGRGIFLANFGEESNQGNEIFPWVNNDYGVDGEAAYLLYVNDSIRESRNTFTLQSGNVSYGSANLTIPTKTTSHTVPLYVFGSQQLDLPEYTGPFTSYNMRLYSMKVYEGDTLVRDIVPCYRDLDIGLCDMVTETFYANIGTGSFNKGNDIVDPTSSNLYNYDYTGTEATFVAPTTGLYKLEVWGAQGGNSINSFNENKGGYGAYSKGEISLTAGDTLYINVGGQAATVTTINGSTGGYNGGGNGGNALSDGSYSEREYRGGAGGGGATHIATQSGLLSSLENNKSSVLIVAGGGGGATSHWNQGMDGGSGGGSTANAGINCKTNPSSDHCSSFLSNNDGGTQESGYAFGQGQSGLADAENSDWNHSGRGGAGGGYYGGYASQAGYYGAAAGGGGSGYISNQLSNGIMYGYNVKSSGFATIHAYLATPAGYLEVNGVEYNSFTDAIAAVNETGTIRLLRDITISDQITFPAGKTITFDLNGHNIKFNKTVINNGVLTITDTKENGSVTNNYDDLFKNNHTITLNKGLYTAHNSVIYSNNSRGSITVNSGSTLSATNGITINGTQDITINGAEIKASQHGIECVGSSCNITMNGGKIIAVSRGITTSVGGILNINDVEITGGDYGLYMNGPAKTVTIDNSKITATNYDGIRQDSVINPKTDITITDSEITGVRYGIFSYYDNLDITDSIITVTGDSRDYYAIYGHSNDTITLNGDTQVLGKKSSVMYCGGTLYINDDTIISSERDNGYGIAAEHCTINMADGIIQTPGSNSYAIFSFSDSITYNMTGGKIDSGHIGFYLSSSTNTTKNINILSGDILAATYGINLIQNYNVVIGDISTAVDRVAPSIEGGIYSFYKTAGVITFNNGILKGATKAFSGAVDNVRTGYEIYYGQEPFSEKASALRTYSVTEASVQPVSKVAKDGDGYAKVTYKPSTPEDLSNITIVDEIVDENPTIGTIENPISVETNLTDIPDALYSYTGTEEEFIAPVTGVYKIEAWGAQGGKDLYNGSVYGTGGYGGYSTGYVTLLAGQKLYINVGGQGGVGSLTDCAPGGYNGGGKGSNDGGSCGQANDDEASGGGGGASHVATQSGLLNTFENDVDKLLIVAGGGGGASYAYQGASGGGYIGGTNDRTNSNSGTQTNGYAFGQGQDGTGAADSDGVAGGGGGYYGGFANDVGYHSAGSGGSGYIANSLLLNKYMYCYDCQTSNDIDTKTKSNGTNSCHANSPTKDCAKEGDGYVRISYSLNSNEYDFSNDEQVFIAPSTGKYLLEVWGAQGGYTVGGYGGYSVGVVELQKNDTIYINVGGQPTNNGVGGYNGGGANASSNYYNGGGATSITKSSGLLSTFENNKSDVLIVAGGGGGGAEYYGDVPGGHAGGYIGNIGSASNNDLTLAGGGTQTVGGSAGVGSAYTGKDGSFGQGGNSYYYGGSGGGGWYGGGSAGTNSNTAGSGAGGSGYIGSSALSLKHMYCYNCQTTTNPSSYTKSDGENSCVNDSAKADCAKKGNGYARITNISNNYEFDYTGDQQYVTVNRSGIYKLETWGASGGNVSSSYKGGYGSYSVGEIRLKAGDTLYVNVGGQGTASQTDIVLGGYNGGGDGHGGTCNGYTNRNGSSGGGATSIAKVSGVLSDLEDYKGTLNDNGTPDNDSDDYYQSNEILIVAGGGGGSFNIDNWMYGSGGHAGGIKGGSGIHNRQSDTTTDYATGGTQISGGLPGDGYTDISTRSDYFYEVTSGYFGRGGDTTTWPCLEGGGGGGGFFGGGSGSESSGAAGSGYIANPNLTNKLMYCYNCQTNTNSETYTKSNGTSSCVSANPTAECSKTGNGYAKLQLIEDSDENNYVLTYVTQYGTLSFDSRTYFGEAPIEAFPEITYDGEYIFDGWFLDQQYTKKVTTNTIVKKSATLYAKWIDYSSYCQRERTFDFGFTNNEQTFTPECNGTYTLEVWGASGGGEEYGFGAYSVGDIDLTTTDTLYINVGGQGGYGIAWGGGGYNGGGNGGNSGSGAGGGATHIAIKSGLLSSLVNDKDKVIIVAGGGGGTDDWNHNPPTRDNDGGGGHGGGYISGGAFRDKVEDISTSAGQTGGYSFGLGQSVTTNTDTGGAGGGWYGGYVTNYYNGGGGGGSGYIGNSRLSNASMYGYNVKGIYSSDVSNIAYLIPESDKVINGSTRYTDVQTAFNEASNGDTIKLLDDIDISYDITNSKNVTLDLNGYDLTTSKSIINNGELVITNSVTPSNKKYLLSINTNTLVINSNKLTISNIGINAYNAIENEGNLTLSFMSTNASNIAVNNENIMTISDSIITGTNYAVYNNTTQDIEIENSVLTGTTALYNHLGTKITNSYNTFNGNITNNHSNGTMNIAHSSLNGVENNNGSSTLDDVTITYVSDSSEHIKTINNYGTVNISNSTINNTSNRNASSTTSNTVGIRNYSGGTLISNNNTYNIKHTTTYKDRWLIPIENNGLLRTTGDIFNMDYGYRTSAIYNSTSSTATVSNPTVNITNVSGDAVAFRNVSGTMTITSGNVETYNSGYGYAIMLDDGSVTTTGVNYNLHDNDRIYGMYLNNGTLEVSGGDSKLYANYEAYLMYGSATSVTFNSGKYDVKSSGSSYNSYLSNTFSRGTVTFNGGEYLSTSVGKHAHGIMMSGGTLNITGGTFKMNAAREAYGIEATGGTVTIGTEGGEVSTTSPYIEAIGTTSGLGFTKGTSDLYFYDGKIVGSTEARATGEIINGTEEYYDLKVYTDPDTGYKYCQLEIRM